MPIVRFQTNIAETFRLRSLDGKPVESNYGGMQHMFTAEEGTFYVSDKVGAILTQQFRTLGVKPGEAVEITKAEVGRGPERRTQWMVAKSITVGEQVNGTLAVPAPASEIEQQLAASIRLAEQRKQAQTATVATPPPAWATFLVEQSNALVDAYAQVLKHSARHEGLVKGDDVRSLFLSAFINVTKGGNRNAV
ncbi:MAG TPA: hypothetical protein VKE42_03920 [Candidatus Cybelea sp.]|nr:hypothetical protein [Candidatus Cybelea sp.]